MNLPSIDQSRSDIGKTYYVSGPKELTIQDVTAAFSKVLNRPVEYVPVSIEMWQENFIKIAGKNPYLLQHLSSILSLFANLRLKTGTEARRLSVQQIRAQSPLSFEEFLQTKGVSLGALPSVGQTA
jgi:hypothetical protein